MARAGLRVDVDTFVGTRDGVPRLLETLARQDVRATFFFSVGPDNMGRHLWRLARPRFAAKMLRSRAPSLYGWSILLAGTAWPGRDIGAQLADVIRATAAAGHEVGLHAWDHHAWQAGVARWSPAALRADIARGVDRLSEIIGRPVTCSATAGWRTTQAVVDAKAGFDFRYNSDCRGASIFRPRLSNGGLGAPQIPVDLPTYDEQISRQYRIAAFNDDVLARLGAAGAPHVYTVHAEVEGGVLAPAFEHLLVRAAEQGVAFDTLSSLLDEAPADWPAGRLVAGMVPGREGWLACQAPLKGI